MTTTARRSSWPAGLAPDVITCLVESAAASESSAAVRSRALEWAADAAAETPGTAAPALRALIGELTRAARDAAAATPEPPAMEAQSSGQRRADATPLRWQYAHRIAVLPLPAELRPERDRALDELELDDSQQTIAEALAALADATADARDTLDSGQEKLSVGSLPSRFPNATPQRIPRPGRARPPPPASGPSLCPGISRQPSRQPGTRPSLAPTPPARSTRSPAADPSASTRVSAPS